MGPWFFVFIMFISFVPLISVAEIYRWQDADGKWHFSDEKRHAAQAEKVESVELGPMNTADKVTVDYDRERREQLRLEQERALQAEREQQEQQKKHRSQDDYCSRVEQEYIKLTDFYTGDPDHVAIVLVDENNKPISRREQDRQAEEFRLEANAKGCRIAQTKGVRYK